MQHMKSVVEPRFLSALKERRTTAFNDFYDHYAPALYGTIRKSFLNEDSAKETLVITFKRIWSNLPNFDASKETLFAWSVKIARKETNKQKLKILLKQLWP